MDNGFENIQNILSDPESMKQIEELAEMIQGIGGDEKENSNENQNAETDEKNDGDQIDIAKIMQIFSLLNSEENNKDTALLLALKPHLREEKQEKIDKAIKIMRLLSILKAAGNSGLLSDLIKF